jgi:hypothetical protein
MKKRPRTIKKSATEILAEAQNPEGGKNKSQT